MMFLALLCCRIFAQDTRLTDSLDQKLTVDKEPVFLSGNLHAYPPAALKQGLEGSVEIELLVDDSGAVDSVAITKPLHPLLDSTAAASARAFKFIPAKMDNRPVSVLMTVLYKCDPLNAIHVDSAVTVKGMVLDQSGLPVHTGAEVFLSIDSLLDTAFPAPLPLYIRKIALLPGQTPDNSRIVTRADSAGNFAFRAIPACRAHITINAPGYLAYNKKLQIGAADTPVICRLIENLREKNEVVVTGRGGSLTSPDIKSALALKKTIAGGFTVESVESFDRKGGENFEDLLKNTPGVFTQSESGGATKVSIRGSGIQSEDEPIGVEYLLDGFPFNQGDGEVNLEDFDLQSLQYAEVYRGANAFKYGAYTLGGAMNLVPQTGLSAPALRLRVLGGSFGHVGADASVAGSNGFLDGYMSASDGYRDGARAHGRENVDHVFGDAGWRSGDFENRVYLLYAGLDQLNPGGLTKDELAAAPLQAGDSAVSQNYGKTYGVIRLADKLSWRTKNGRIDAGGMWTYRNEVSRQFYSPESPDGIGLSRQNDGAAVLNVIDSAEQFGRPATLTFGTMFHFARELSTKFVNNHGDKGDSTSSFSDWSVNLPVYAEDQWRVVPKLSVIGGIQAVFAQRQFTNTMAADSSGDRYERLNLWGVNPKAGAIYEWGEDNQAYANVSRSWQPPSFDNLISLNTDSASSVAHLEYSPLLAQTAWTTEAGSRGKAKWLDWDLSVYRSWLRNELLSVNDVHGNNIGTVNVAKSVHQGIEAELTVDLFKSRWARKKGKLDEGTLALTQSYTLNDFYFDDDPVYGYNPIAGIPRHFYQAELLYTTKSGWYCGPDVRWCMVRYPVDQAGSLFSDPYALLGFSAGFRAEKGLSVFADAHNLTNIRYAASVEPIPDAGNADPGDLALFYPGEGVNFSAGIEWRF